MDVDSQVEEFDSSSSESGSSSEDEEQRSEDEPSEPSGDEEAGAGEELLGSGDWVGAKSRGSRKRRKDRKRHAAGMRKKLRTHYESVEDFNPEARSAQSAELERIRRLELQQSIISPPTHAPPPAPLPHTSQPNVTVQDPHKPGSESPEMVVVDLSHKATPPADTIVIDSGSDSDSTEKGKPQAAKTEAHASSGRGEVLHRKYDDPTVPRPDGKLIVNLNHAPNEPDVFLAPQVARIVKPHQMGGIRFLYDNIIESVSRFSTSPGFGCILAHSMGLGKTLQVISFIDVFMRYTQARRTLCVVPVNTLQNWINEFDRWLPVLPANQNPSSSHMTPLPGDDTQYRTFGVFLLSESSRTMEARVKVITEWQEGGGVLLIGYEMFRLLSLSVPSLAGNKMAVKRRKNAPVKTDTGTIDLDETEKEMDALIGIQRALCNPGPDLVVCDEGHRIKNDFTNISQALKRIRTRRRIVMTGYPLQNNLMEYWCMVDFVRPKYLGTKQEFADLFERPITNGQCADSTPNDVRLMRYRSHVLHSLLEGFVLRRGHEILKSTLPPKFEHVLFLRPSEVQGVLYNYNMSLIQQGGGVSTSTGPLKAFAVCTKIWNHPDIYYNEVMAQEARDPSLTTLLDDAGLSKSAISGLKVTGGESSCKLDWPHPQLPSYQPGCLENSPKMMVLMELIDKSVHFGDKILVFSQSLSTLSYVEKLLSQRLVPKPNAGLLSGNATMEYQSVNWAKNKNYCRIDGSTSSLERDKLINGFNSPANKECWAFLLSTKAGCLGINLIGANRVVVLDVSWNPCYDAQAVCRVYRYGQTKPCYIYRLVCDGTMERKIYDRQISKQGMSDRVVDHLQPERHLSTQDIISLITPLTTLPPSRDLSPFAQEFLFDPVLMSLCCALGQLLTKLPFKHESLLMDSADERMTDLEKYLALRGFQAEWKALKSGPASIHEYRAMQGKQAAAMSSTPPVHMATPTGTPPPSLAVPSNPMAKLPLAPVINKPNEPVEVICLDSDEDEQKSATPPKPPPSQVTSEPVKALLANLASILSTSAQTHFMASQMPTQQKMTPIKPQPPPTPSTTTTNQSVLGALLKTPTTLTPTVTVTTTQLSQLSEVIVDSLKTQLLTTSLTRDQQDQNKMAAEDQIKKKASETADPKERSPGDGTQVMPTVTSSAESAVVLSAPVTSQQSQEVTQDLQSAQTTPTEELGPADETNVHLNSNTNNATEENTSLFPQGRYVVMAPPTSMQEDASTAAAPGNRESWKTQPEKCRKASKKERYPSGSSWQPPHPPPLPTTNFTPCSIPLLSPIAAHLLYISTGTRVPSSPPEDVSKYPPIVSPTPSSPGSSQSDVMDWEYLKDTSLTDEEGDTGDKTKGGQAVTPPTSADPPSIPDTRSDNNNKSLTMSSSSASNSVGVAKPVGEQVASSYVSSGWCTTTQSSVNPMLCSPLPLGQSSVSTGEGQSTLGRGAVVSSVIVDRSVDSRSLGTSCGQPICTGGSVGLCPVQSDASVTRAIYDSRDSLPKSTLSLQLLPFSVATPSTSLATPPISVTTPSISLTVGQGDHSLRRSPSQEGMAILTELLNELPPSPSLCSQPVLTPLSMLSNISTSQPLSMPSNISTSHPLSMPSNTSTSQPLSMLSNTSTSQPLSMPSNTSISQPLSMPSNTSTSQPLRTARNIATSQPPSMPRNVSTSHPLSMPRNVSTSHPLSMPRNISTAQPLIIPSNISLPQPPSMASDIPSSQPLSVPRSIATSQPLSMPRNVSTSQSLSMPSYSSSSQPPSMPRNVSTSQPLIIPSNISSSQPPSMPRNVSSSQPPSISSNISSSQPPSMSSDSSSSQPLSMPSKVSFGHPSSTCVHINMEPGCQAVYPTSYSTSSLHSVVTATSAWQSGDHQSSTPPNHSCVSTVQSHATPVTTLSSLATILSSTPSHLLPAHSSHKEGTFTRTVGQAEHLKGQGPTGRIEGRHQAEGVEKRRHSLTSEHLSGTARSARAGDTQQSAGHVVSKEDHMTSKNHSKPKWIQSFCESETPAKGHVPIQPPSPSMYDPQPIVCIDNWAKSGSGDGSAEGEIPTTGQANFTQPSTFIPTPSSGSVAMTDVLTNSCSDVHGGQDLTTNLTLKRRGSQQFVPLSTPQGSHGLSLSTSVIEGAHPSPPTQTPPLAPTRLISPPPTILGFPHITFSNLDCDGGRVVTTHPLPTSTPHHSPVAAQQPPPPSAVVRDALKPLPAPTPGAKVSINNHENPQLPWKQSVVDTEVNIDMYDNVPDHVTMLPLPRNSVHKNSGPNSQPPTSAHHSAGLRSSVCSEPSNRSYPNGGLTSPSGEYRTSHSSANSSKLATVNGHARTFSGARPACLPLPAASSPVRLDLPPSEMSWTTNQTHFSSSPPPAVSNRERLSFSGGQSPGETCLMTRGLQQLARTKKTAVVSPYNVVKSSSETDPLKVAQGNMDKRLGEQLSMAADGQTQSMQPGRLSPPMEKLMTSLLSQTAAPSECRQDSVHINSKQPCGVNPQAKAQLRADVNGDPFCDHLPLYRKPSTLPLNSPGWNGMSLQVPSRNEMNPQPANRNSMSPQPTSINGMTPQLTSVNRMSPQLPSKNGMNPQPIGMNRMSSQLPSTNGMNPQLTSVNRMSPEFPSKNGMNPQPTSVNRVNPEFPSKTGMNPQPTSVNRMSPQLPSTNGMNPQPTSVNRMSPEFPSTNGMNPQLTSVNRMSPEFPSKNGMNPQPTIVNRVSPQLPSKNGMSLQSMNRMNPKLPSRNGMTPQPTSMSPQLPSRNGMIPQPTSMSPQLPSRNGMIPQPTSMSPQLPSRNGMSVQSMNRTSPQVSTTRNRKPSDTLSDSFLRTQLNTPSATHSPIATTPTHASSPLLHGRRNSTHSTADPTHVPAEDMANKTNNHFNFALPTKTPSLSAHTMKSPDPSQEGVWLNSVRDHYLPAVSTPNIQGAMGTSPVVQRASLNVSNPTLNSGNQKFINGPSTTPLSQGSDPASHQQPLTKALLQSWGSAFTSVQSEQATGGHQQRSVDPPQPNLPTWVGPSPLAKQLSSQQGVYLNTVQQTSSQLPGTSLSARPMGNSPTSVSMAVRTSPSHFPTPSPVNSLGGSPNQAHLQGATSPCCLGVSPTPNPVGATRITQGHVNTSPAHHSSPQATSGAWISPSHNRIQSPTPQATAPKTGISPSPTAQPNLLKASPALTLGSLSPTQLVPTPRHLTQSGATPGFTQQGVTPQQVVTPSLAQQGATPGQNQYGVTPTQLSLSQNRSSSFYDQPISANHATFMSVDSASRSPYCDTPHLHFQPVPTGHAQNLSHSSMTPTTNNASLPVLNNPQNQPGGQSAPSEQANYTVPSLYGHSSRPLVPAASVHQLLSPTQSHSAQLPSFDQIQSSNRHGYLDCHGNCRVGIATRMCK